MVLNQGWFCSPEDIWLSLEPFFIFTTVVEGVLLASTWVEARDTAEHPAMHKIVPTQRIIWSKVPTVWRLKNLDVECVAFRAWRGLPGAVLPYLYYGMQYAANSSLEGIPGMHLTIGPLKIPWSSGGLSHHLIKDSTYLISVTSKWSKWYSIRCPDTCLQNVL